jgi:hypothetical protein
MRRTAIRWLAVLMIATAAGGAAGCVPMPSLMTLPAFVSGWLLHDLVVQVEGSSLTCYRNGAPIDCAEIPEDVLPAGG